MTDVFDFSQQPGGGAFADAGNGFQELALLFKIRMAIDMVIDLLLSAFDLSLEVGH